MLESFNLKQLKIKHGNEDIDILKNNYKALWSIELNKELGSLVVWRRHLSIEYIWVRVYIVSFSYFPDASTHSQTGCEHPAQITRGTCVIELVPATGSSKNWSHSNTSVKPPYPFACVLHPDTQQRYTDPHSLLAPRPLYWAQSRVLLPYGPLLGVPHIPLLGPMSIMKFCCFHVFLRGAIHVHTRLILKKLHSK